MIDKTLYQEIKEYCKLNNLKVKDFINTLLRKAFTIEKYGEKPPFMMSHKSEEPSHKNIEETHAINEIKETPNEKEEKIEEVKVKKINKRRLA